MRKACLCEKFLLIRLRVRVIRSSDVAWGLVDFMGVLEAIYRYSRLFEIRYQFDGDRYVNNKFSLNIRI